MHSTHRSTAYTSTTLTRHTRQHTRTQNTQPEHTSKHSTHAQAHSRECGAQIKTRVTSTHHSSILSTRTKYQTSTRTLIEQNEIQTQITKNMLCVVGCVLWAVLCRASAVEKTEKSRVISLCGGYVDS